jgi:putative transposase
MTKTTGSAGESEKLLLQEENLQCYYGCGYQPHLVTKEDSNMSNKDNDISSLSHSKWRCHYHVVFAPKYRRQAIYGKIRIDIGKILRQLCDQKGIEIIEAELCPDHVHMLLAIPPKYSVAQIMGYLKGKSSLMIFDRHANMKYKYGNRHFWCRGYYVDTVGQNKKAIEEYIRNQLQEDIANDQISLKEYIDPFTGSKNT